MSWRVEALVNVVTCQQFTIDKIGAGLNDIAITYGEKLDAEAWKIFFSNLRERAEEEPRAFPRRIESPPSPPPPMEEKPSIVVLPFSNMSADPADEYLGDGITEEITTALSKIPYVLVIARTSSFAYKGKSVKVKQISDELGARYLLEGSVRKSGKKVRIAVQLIDAQKDHHLWAERYDLDLEDLFALQDEITLQIITALQVKLTVGEVAQVYPRGTKSLQAFMKVIQAMAHSTRHTKEDVTLARKLNQEAIALDPNYPRAYNGLAQTYMLEVLLGTCEDPDSCLAQAVELTRKSIALDESDVDSHSVLGYLYAMRRQYEKALQKAEEAVAVNPNSLANLLRLGFVLLNAGKAEEAIIVIKRARRVTPRVTYQSYFFNLSLAYFLTGQYNKAVETVKEGLQQVPDNFLLYPPLAASYLLMGRKEEARAAAGEIPKLNPKFSLKRYSRTLYFKNKRDVDQMVQALREAGLS